MKPVGIVRKVDQLGRIVLPKSLRKRYEMNEGDPIEILVEGEHILLEKFRPRCVFCGSIEQVGEFKAKSVCGECRSALHNLKG